MAKRVLLSVSRSVLFVLLMLSFTITLLLFCLLHIVLSDTVYRSMPEDETFVSEMTEIVLKDLEDDVCEFYGFPYEVLRTAVTPEWVKELSRQYTGSLYAATVGGGEVAAPPIDSDAYYRVILDFFNDLPAEERMENPEEEARLLAEECAASTAQVLQSGLVERVIPPAHRYIYGNATVKFAAGLFFPMVGVTALLSLLSLLWFGSTWRQRLYATAGSLFLGSTLLAVPLWLIRRYDLAGNLAIGAKTPLKLYVDGILNGLVERMTTVAVWVFAVCAALLLVSVVAAVWPSEKSKGKTPMKILCIGNSFSQDATRYLEGMAGGELYVRNCYIGGCSLQRHCDNIEADAATYDYEKEGVAIEPQVALSDALTRESWDWVTVQQVSHQSGKPESYEPCLTQLLAYIREKCPGAKIALHRTWAYETGSEHPGFVNYDNDRDVMFDAILEATEQAAAAHDLPIIRAGDAVQEAGKLPAFDAAVGGQSLYRDMFHMHLIYGRYLVALRWYTFFTGKSAKTVTLVPDGADEALLDKLKEIAG